jgi:hypothetical protein
MESIAMIGPGAWRIESKACLDENPLLLPALGGGGVRLAPMSPCIDAGDPSYLSPKGETDVDGDPRLLGGRVDIGADEFAPPATPTPAGAREVLGGATGTPRAAN